MINGQYLPILAINLYMNACILPWCPSAFTRLIASSPRPADPVPQVRALPPAAGPAPSRTAGNPRTLHQQTPVITEQKMLQQSSSSDQKEPHVILLKLHFYLVLHHEREKQASTKALLKE